MPIYHKIIASADRINGKIVVMNGAEDTFPQTRTPDSSLINVGLAANSIPDPTNLNSRYKVGAGSGGSWGVNM